MARLSVGPPATSSVAVLVEGYLASCRARGLTLLHHQPGRPFQVGRPVLSLVRPSRSGHHRPALLRIISGEFEMPLSNGTQTYRRWEQRG